MWAQAKCRRLGSADTPRRTATSSGLVHLPSCAINTLPRWSFELWVIKLPAWFAVWFVVRDFNRLVLIIPQVGCTEPESRPPTEAVGVTALRPSHRL